MGRPKNTELKKRIEETAFRLFTEYGYDKTSYSMIARECGISKNLVQYYFKKKELLATSFMETVINGILEE
ncbi:MAG: TetR/AcrR family transcriptional regulator, partial [Eggerthellaceae bacterium]|nr:TetR/AcrR family transcriptional regulator [Eggerthellaceae bacterium]